MKVTSEHQPSRETVLTINVDESEVEPYLDQAYRQAVRRLNIPGFRKGKAPRRIVEQMLGREYLLNEALDTMVQDFTTKAVEQEDLELGGIPSVSIEQFDPPIFKATVPLVPEVDLGDYESIRVEKREPEVKEEQIDSVLEQLRQEQAVWEPADGPVELGDLIEVTVHGWVDEDGEKREIIASDNTEYMPREGTRFPVPEFDEHLVGLPVDEKTTFTIEVPEDFENEDLAGKTAEFEATIHQVKRNIPPELDDEFAKGVGDGFESMDALRERIANDLREREERTVESTYQSETLDKVMEGATITISPLIIDHEVEHYVHDRQEQFNQGRFNSIEDYQQAIAWQAMSEDEIKEQARPAVEDRLKRANILREVAKQQGFEATDEEVDAEIETIASDAGEEADQVRALFQDSERRESIRRVLVNRKTMDYLTAIAARNETGEQPKAASASKAKAEEETAATPEQTDESTETSESASS